MLVEFTTRLVAGVAGILRVAERRDKLRRAKHAGMKVGEGTRFVGSQEFGTEPYLISIGGDCLITHDVRFVTHDGSIQVPLIQAGSGHDDVYGKKSIFASISVGSNCFIGTGATLLPGSDIGDNSIVGAGSIVRGAFPPGSVIAGMPAKIVGSVDEFFKRNQGRIISFDGNEGGNARAEIIRRHTT